ncbi:MAG TPA: aminotransferase DegT, partial [Akkermansia sp.]|nr:aminotransferase DegT [Akkermansia sp.]
GYNYRMSNVIAGIVLGQWKHLGEHIAAKKRIYERYADRLEGLEVEMNPYDASTTEPNYWLSCMRLDENSLHVMTAADETYTY